MNHRTLFTTYHMGFDNYNAWSEYVQAMWDKHPLGCDSFGEEWLQKWEALGRLLEKPARARFCSHVKREWFGIDTGTVAEMLALTAHVNRHLVRRVELFDGTIVHEWGA
jgi:hypothetical protein